MNTNNSLLTPNQKLRTVLFVTLSIYCISCTSVQAQSNSPKAAGAQSNFGYIDKGDSIEFVFGLQRTITISGVEVVLEKRFSEINQVNLAGDFNGWNPDLIKYEMKKAGGTLYKITVCKASLGKTGDLKQFKFVLNHKYWVEPPAQATNTYTGSDRNTNLTLKL